MRPSQNALHRQGVLVFGTVGWPQGGITSSKHSQSQRQRQQKEHSAVEGEKQMPFTNLLDSLRLAAQSNSAFVAYIGLVAAWVYVAVTRAKVRATRESLPVLEPKDRAQALKRLHPEYPTTGMSAREFIRSRRNGQLLIAFIAFLIAVLAIATVTMTRL